MQLDWENVALAIVLVVYMLLTFAAMFLWAKYKKRKRKKSN